MRNSDFDLDLQVGEAGEAYLAKLLGLDTVEVKRDLKWFNTGNLYIETACYSTSQGMYVASGLSTTKASHWAFVLGDIIVIVKTSALKDYISYQIEKSLDWPAECKIEPNPSKGYLIKVEWLLKNHRETKTAELS